MALCKWTDHEVEQWLTSPLGQALVGLEKRLAEEILDGIFGEETLQLGHWGENRSFLGAARTQRTVLLAETLAEEPASNHAVGEFHRLPIASDSIDSIIRLLDMRILSNRGYFFRWPVSGTRKASVSRWERRGQRWWSEMSACYMLSAQKRISTLTPVRPVWSKKPKVVAGLAEPSTRIARIRFEQKD